MASAFWTLYGNVRAPRALNCIRSKWSLAPRVLPLTETGDLYQERWRETLECYRDAIDDLLNQTLACPP
jgi:hypothetical protein